MANHLKTREQGHFDKIEDEGESRGGQQHADHDRDRQQCHNDIETR
jgi:hypothetical protein